MSFLEDERRSAERAPFLFSDLPMEVQERVMAREQKYDDWTAARLFSQRREIYEVVVKMLGADIPVRFIADVCNVGPKTIAAVREAEPDAVTAFRAVMSRRRAAMMHRCADVIAACLESDSEKAMVRAKDTAIVMNILDGQQRLDQGAPTVILQVHEAPAVDKFREWMRTVVDVQGDVLPQTGSDRGVAPAKGGAPGAVGGELGVDPATEGNG